MQQKAFFVIGYKVRTTNEEMQSVRDIGNLWEDCLKNQLLEEIPNAVDRAIYAVYTDYESDHRGAFSVILGRRVVTLDLIPKRMTGVEIPSGEYVKFTKRGDIGKGLVFQMWREIWESDLTRAYRADYEYFDEETSNPHDAKVDIFIGVK